MIPYSYGNIHSSASIYLPIILALLILSVSVIAFIKLKDKIMKMSDLVRSLTIIGAFAVIGCICTLLVTVPYKSMSPTNENAKYEVLGTTEIVKCDDINQTVTVMKDGKEVTEDTLITISYDDPHLEVRRYSWCGMYRDYNVTLIPSPDAVKIEE